MAWSGLDQRNFPRVQANCIIWILEGSKHDIKSKTENLGVGGARVILGEKLEKLSIVRLRLTLPGIAEPIECGGKIVWTVRSKDPASHRVTYDTGIQFLNLRNEDKQTVFAFTHAQV